MSDNSFEPPWRGNNPLLENTPKSTVIGEIVCKLEQLLWKREKNSCPSDDIDTRILTAVRCAMDSVKYLIEHEHDLTDLQKQFLVKKSRLLIKEANNVIEKTLKLRSH